MKRQRGRNRGGGGGGKPQQNTNRSFDSNGPEGIKVRGNAQHVFEKYQQLARDATSAGDRVLAENHLQHAEHYFRLIRAMQPQRPASEILGRDTFTSGYDIDFEDEGAQAQAEAADEASAEAEGGEPVEGRDRSASWQERPREVRDDRNRDDRNRDNRDGPRRDRWRERDDRFRADDRPRDDRPRDDRPRDDRPRDDRQMRDDRPRDDRPRDERPRDERPRDERPRDDRPREDRPRDERPREDRPRDRYERPRDERPRDQDRADRPERDPLPVVEPQGAGPLARERAQPVLRDSEGGESHAPAFLQAAAPRPEPAGDEDGAARKPRRRRAPRAAGADPTPSEEA